LHHALLLTSLYTIICNYLLLCVVVLGNAIIGIEGFEQIIDSGGLDTHSSTNSIKLQYVLSQLLSILLKYNGLIILLCDVTNINHMIIQQTFSNKIFSFIRSINTFYTTMHITCI
jgi:hypothetical protein